MPVDYIHYILPYSKTTLLGNVPTFFYFGITLLPPKKKVLQTSRLIKYFFSFQASFSTILSIWTFKLSEMPP